MNTSIYRRSPALRWLPFSWAFTSVFAWVLSGTLSRFHELDMGDTSLLWEVLTPVLLGSLQGSIVVAKLAGMHVRAHGFELGLPIAQRSIVRQRLAMRLTVFVSPVLFACVTTWIRAGHVVPTGAILAAGLATASAICSATCIFHAFWPRAAKLDASQLIMLTPFALLLLFSPMAFSEMGIRGYGAPVLVPLAISLLVRCFQVCEFRFDEPLAIGPAWSERPATQATSGDPAVLTSPPLGPLRWSFLRGAFLRLETMPVMALFVFFAFTGISSLFGTLLTFFALSVFLSAALLRKALPAIGGFAGLPIPRRRLAPWLLLPVLGIALMTPVLKEAGPLDDVDRYRFPGGVAVDYPASDDFLGGEGSRHSHVRVPGHHWRFANLDEDRTVTAPWGESVTPLAHPVFWGSSVITYNPYDVEGTSSVRFMAWQLGRAIREIHGVSLTEAEVLERWYADLTLPNLRETVAEVRPRRRTAAEFGLAVRPGRSPAGGWMNVFTIVLGWCIGGIGSMLIRRPSYGVGRARRQLLFRVTLAFATGAVGATLVFAGAKDPFLAGAVDAKLRGALSWVTGGHTGWLVALTAATAVLGYWILVRRLERIEIPPPLKNGWTGKPRGVFG